ncbi:hypothetical protein IWW36_000598 [Coemansia brasiliensis]|uniref:Uncharacterized protein n=1 Tax=Coemansia brasiliensis TaxID=2650707 RepID=A0A9W8ID48_9FUNG|nr:hypothetical protein IWW36_000598 [Coemansia brasiliensis]
MVDLRWHNLPVVPDAAALFTRRVLILVNGSNSGIDTAQRLISSSVVPKLPRARVLGLCIYTVKEVPCQTDQYPSQFARTLRTKLPSLQDIWLQRIGKHTPLLQTVLAALTSPSDSKPQPRVTAVHLPSISSTARDVDIIRDHARDLQFLFLGRVSGGVLNNLLYHTSGKQVIYKNLQRLIFTVLPNMHIYADLPAYTQNPFPQLQELYFDDEQIQGLPREEWFAPLFDIFFSHQTQLKYLTFPIVYNTQRIVSQKNCPKLVGLRHIKCCWATGVWSTLQRESDSTRVLSSIASISTLESYVHPSYIAKLSSVPSDISCKNLCRLDLYGWPLTLENMVWIAGAFEKLHTLRVTLAQSDNLKDYESQWLKSSLLSSLTVGCASTSPTTLDIQKLGKIISLLPQLSYVWLFDTAFVFISTARSSLASGFDSKHMRDMQIYNLNDSSAHLIELSRLHSLWSPLARLTTAAPVHEPERGNRRFEANTSWNLIHPLLIDS